MSDIPDGAEYHVAAMAIAWEITKRTMSEFASENTKEAELENWLKLYEEAYKKVFKIKALHFYSKKS